MSIKPRKIVSYIIVGVVFCLGILSFLLKKEKEIVLPPLLEPIRIGGVIPLTGSRAEYGVPLQRAAQMAVDEINAQGGIRGEQIEIFWEDGKCEEKSAATAVNRLIRSHHTQYIIGGVCSLETLKIATVTQTERVLLISPASTSNEISSAGDLVFRLVPPDSSSGAVSARFLLNKLQIKSALIIAEESSYAQGVVEGFKHDFPLLGGKITAIESYNLRAKNIDGLLNKIKEYDIEAVFLVSTSKVQGARIIKEIKKNHQQAVIVVDDALMDDNFIQNNKEALEGVYSFEEYFDSSSARVKSFLDSYQAQYAEKPKFPYFMANVYSSIFLIKEGIEQNGVEVDKISKWMLGLSRWPAVSDDLTFDKNGDPLARFYILRVKEGKIKRINVLGQ